MRLRILCTLLALLGANSFAGGWTSSGGDAVVCQDSDGHIQSAELFDLYEGRAMLGLNPLPQTTPAAVLAHNFAQTLDPLMGAQTNVITRTDQIIKTMRFLPSGTGLVPVKDIGSIIIPKTCTVMQLAVYTGDDQVYIDSDIWAKLDETNRAGLILHEAVYWYLRLSGETTSVRTRMFVANVFAGTPIPPLRRPPPSEPSLIETCSTRFSDLNPSGTPVTLFSTYSDLPGRLTLQFEAIDGIQMLSQSTITGQVSVGWPISNISAPKPSPMPGGEGGPADGISGRVKTLIDNISLDVIIMHSGAGHMINIWDQSGYHSVYFACQVVHFYP